VRWHLEIVHVQTMIQTCSNSFYVERVWESGNNRLSQVGLRLMWRLEDGPGFSFLDTIWDQRTQRKHPITQQVPWTRLYDIAWFIQWCCMMLQFVCLEAESARAGHPIGRSSQTGTGESSSRTCGGTPWAAR
jgi:hypothetical protein